MPPWPGGRRWRTAGDRRRKRARGACAESTACPGKREGYTPAYHWPAHLRLAPLPSAIARRVPPRYQARPKSELSEATPAVRSSWPRSAPPKGHVVAFGKTALHSYAYRKLSAGTSQQFLTSLTS